MLNKVNFNILVLDVVTIAMNRYVYMSCTVVYEYLIVLSQVLCKMNNN